MIKLRQLESTTARALEFTILTAVRTKETQGAIWSEFDLTKKVWTIPAERMKADREHRAPLCARAIQILEQLLPYDADGSALPPEPERRPALQAVSCSGHRCAAHPQGRTGGTAMSFYRQNADPPPKFANVKPASRRRKRRKLAADERKKRKDAAKILLHRAIDTRPETTGALVMENRDDADRPIPDRFSRIRGEGSFSATESRGAPGVHRHVRAQRTGSG